LKNVNPEAQTEWGELQDFLQNVSLTHEDDVISWGLTASKRFCTSSLYKFMTSGGVGSSTAKRIWKCKVPLKIKVFLWQVFQNRILIAQQLCARNWTGSERSVLCGTNEDIDHLLFNSPLASFAWAFASEALGWQGAPRSLEDMMCNWTPRIFRVGRQLGLACFASVAWVVWHIRNKFCIQHVFPNNYLDVVYLALSFIQKWCILM
jgi:hypothetical protein